MANGETPPLGDGVWIAMMAVLAALEERFPGISAEVHSSVVSEFALADVVRLHGPKTEPQLRKAYAVAERHLGVAAVVARAPLRSKRKKHRGR